MTKQDIRNTNSGLFFTLCFYPTFDKTILHFDSQEMQISFKGNEKRLI